MGTRRRSNVLGRERERLSGGCRGKTALDVSKGPDDRAVVSLKGFARRGWASGPTATMAGGKIPFRAVDVWGATECCGVT